MKVIMYVLIIITFSSMINLSCNGQEKKPTENNEISNIIEDKFTDTLEIKIFGIYGNFNRGMYVYEINSNDSNRLKIHFGSGSEPTYFRILYNKILSDNEMKDIYEFIKKFDLNKKIGLNDPMWVGTHTFEGTLWIKIDNALYIKDIFMGQDVNSDVYKILNYLNMFTPKGDELPIYGVRRVDEIYEDEENTIIRVYPPLSYPAP